ncbi:hypothetical protein GYH30_041021 [Glycine max]|nr:hypothetical protein GYH30_041021 [Glycine max]
MTLHRGRFGGPSSNYAFKSVPTKCRHKLEEEDSDADTT